MPDHPTPEDHSFDSSEFSLGVEEKLFLVDPVTDGRGPPRLRHPSRSLPRETGALTAAGLAGASPARAVA